MQALSIGKYSNPWAAAGAIATGGLINYVGQRYADARRNKLNREAQRQAMHYNTELWKQQNEYNSPQAQMERFKAAGLNPHLIYGQGTPGNAQGIAPYQAPQMDFTPPQNPLDLLDTYHDTMRSKYDAGLMLSRVYTEELKQLIIEEGDLSFAHNRARIMQMQADIAEASFNGTLEERKAEIAYRIAESSIKQKHAEWTEQGINPSDATWLRMAAEILRDMGVNSESIQRLIGKFINLD